MKTSTDKELDIEEFYIRYGPMVLRRCRSLLGNEQSAHDTMQEVFLKILKNRHRLNGTYPSALLFRIATNVCLNRIRNERNHDTKKILQVAHNLDTFGRDEDRTSARSLLEYILEKEKGFMRTLAVMYFINGMTIKEIAAVMKLSVSGIHKNLEKLRKRIRQKGELS
jgi:RNA polymerase sigma-70 factor (ECF subfamily)